MNYETQLNGTRLGSAAPNGVSTVISGSYRKHLDGLYRVKEFLESEGFSVLSPVGRKAVNPGEEFVVLDADPIEDHRILQDSIFAKMRQSSFHVVHNPNGYLGPACIMEMGYAISIGVQILTTHAVEDPNLKPYTRMFSEVFPRWEQG